MKKFIVGSFLATMMFTGLSATENVKAVDPLVIVDTRDELSIEFED